MALHFLMSDKIIENDPLIKKALSNITMEDYVKMKYESNKEFMSSWVNTLNDFTIKNGTHTKLSSKVKK